MNAINLINAAANDGVYLVRYPDHLRVVGLGTSVKVWAPRFRLVKDDLLEIANPASSGLTDGIVCTPDLEDDLLEAFQERAAIMQFDGGIPQVLAERMAAHYVYAPYSATPIGLHAAGPADEKTSTF